MILLIRNVCWGVKKLVTSVLKSLENFLGFLLQFCQGRTVRRLVWNNSAGKIALYRVKQLTWEPRVVCVYVCVCVCMFVCMYVCMHVCMCVCIYAYICIRMCVYMHIYVYVFIMYACMYVWMHICMYVCMVFLCIHVWVFVSWMDECVNDWTLNLVKLFVWIVI